MNLSGSYRANIISLLTVMVIICAALPGVTVADATSTTTGGVTVFNSGKLDVSYSGGELIFFDDTGANASVSTSNGDVTFVRIPISITDDRADADRDAYSVRLSLGRPTSGNYFVAASNVDAIDVTGTPDGLIAGFTGPTPFIEPVTVITSNDAPAGDFEIVVTVRLTVPAGTVPGIYKSSVVLEVMPVASGNET